MPVSMVEGSSQQVQCQAAIMHLPLIVTVNQTHAFAYSAVTTTVSVSECESQPFPSILDCRGQSMRATSSSSPGKGQGRPERR